MEPEEGIVGTFCQMVRCPGDNLDLGRASELEAGEAALEDCGI